MPELPEVQVVINFLEKEILNLKFKEIEIFIPKIIKNISIKDFKKYIIDSKILSITRKGKYIILNLNNGVSWIVHLRMEGKFFINNKNEYSINKHTVALFELDNNKTLAFEDTRRFATFDIIQTKNINSFEPIKKLSKDPIDESFNYNDLFQKLSKSNKKIKTALLDQTIISGIGNIYVDEILFDVKIHPQTIAKKIPLTQCEQIYNSAKRILLDSIKHNGTTINSFKFNGIETGSYQNYLMVHNKNIKECKKCKNKISFIKVNGRGTFVCDKCQKLF